MIQKDRCDEVLAAGDKIEKLGTSIPVWLYIVDGLLIDAASLTLGRSFIPFLREQEIDRVVLTHGHEDHTGLAQWLQREKGLPVFVHGSSIEAVRSPARLPIYRRMFWGKRPGFQARELPAEIETRGHCFHVVSAPGHSDDHVVFHEPRQGWLFSGDIYVRPRPPVAFVDEHMGTMIKTLRRILELEFDTLFCGHSGIHRNARKVLRNKLEFLLEIRERSRELSARGKSIREIARALFPKRLMITYISLGEWSPSRIIETLLSEEVTGP